ncbi:MAG: hypothetical protein ACXWXN_08170 [Actinomycetota bacterium]
MKIRSLLLVAAGIGIGYTIAGKLREDDPEVVRGPQRRSSTSSPALQVFAGGAQRLADQASVRSVEAIRRARGAIRSRLVENETFDEAAWN